MDRGINESSNIKKIHHQAGFFHCPIQSNPKWNIRAGSWCPSLPRYMTTPRLLYVPKNPCGSWSRPPRYYDTAPICTKPYIIIITIIIIIPGSSIGPRKMVDMNEASFHENAAPHCFSVGHAQSADRRCRYSPFIARPIQNRRPRWDPHPRQSFE
jgi:hypothetical protein